MSLNNLGLGFMFTATDLASRVMGDLEGNLKKLEEVSGQTINGMSKHLQTFGAGVALSAVGVGGLFASFSLADKAGKFESAIAAVGAVSNASTTELNMLKEAAIQAGIATQFSPTQATLGLNELAQAGYNVEESIALLRPALDLAAGSLGKLSPQEAAGVATQAMKAFGIETKYATAAVDQMLMASNEFAMDAGDLPLGLSAAARGAQAMNQSLTETMITFGLVKNTIKGTERAATAVATGMERMVDPKVQQKLASIGVAVADANGQFRPFLDVLKDMAPALAKMSATDAKAFLQKTFGTEALGGIGTILQQITTGVRTSSGEILKGAAAIDYYREHFMSATGVAEGFSKKMLDTFEGQKTLLAGSMETLAIQLGEPFTKALRPAVEFTIGAVNKLIGWLNKLSPGTKVMLATVFLGGSAFLALAGGVLMMVGLLPLFTAMVGIGATMLWGWAAAAWAAVAPFLPFIALGAALGLLIVALSNNWWGLTDAIMEVELAIADFFVELWGDISKWFGTVVDGFVKFGQWLGDAAIDIGAQIAAPFLWYFGVWKKIFGWAADVFSAFGDLVVAEWHWLVEQVTSSEVWKTVVRGAEIMADAVMGVVDTVVGWFTTGWAIVSDGVTRFWDGLVSAFWTGVEMVSGVVSEMVSTLAGYWEAGVDTLVTPFLVGFEKIRLFVGWVADWVMGKLAPILKFAQDVGGFIGELAGKAGGLVEGLPAWLRSQAQTVQDDTGAPAAAGGFSRAAQTAVGQGAAETAGAANEALVAGMMTSTTPQTAFDYDRLAAANAHRPIVTTIQLDGATLAKVQQRWQRADAGRGSRPVPGVP